MNRWKYDQNIRKIAQSGEIPCFKDYPEFMKKLCESLPEDDEDSDERHMIGKLRFGAVCGLVCFSIAIAPSVTAEIQGYWERMKNMENSEKEKYLSELEESIADGDSFSRQLTDSEKAREKELMDSYEAGAAYPSGTVTYIDNESGLQKDKVCFWARTSTLFLPAREMTDEELLQIIDFYYKREHSLRTATKGENEKTDAGKENTMEEKLSDASCITGEEAVSLGKNWLEKLYQVDTSKDGWKIVSEKQEDKADSYYYISFLKQKTREEYFILIGADVGKPIHIQCVYDGKNENVCKGFATENIKKLKRNYKEVERHIKKIEDSKRITECYCECLVDKDKKLKNGVENFYLKYSDGSGWKVKYSLNRKEVFDTRYLDQIEQYMTEMKLKFGMQRVDVRIK